MTNEFILVINPNNGIAPKTKIVCLQLWEEGLLIMNSFIVIEQKKKINRIDSLESDWSDGYERKKET